MKEWEGTIALVLLLPNLIHDFGTCAFRYPAWARVNDPNILISNVMKFIHLHSPNSYLLTDFIIDRVYLQFVISYTSENFSTMYE